MYTEEQLQKAINLAREIKDKCEVFTIESITGLTEICTYDWEEAHTDEEIIKLIKL